LESAVIDDFVALILTNRRPRNVLTYQTLKDCGYTGPIAVVVDDEDPSIDEYRSVYKDEVVVFDKEKAARETQTADNFPGKGAVVFARNASFDVARQLGFTYFIQLDDDYTGFSYRFNRSNKFTDKPIKNLDAVWGAMLRYYQSCPFASLAMFQSGDYIGGGGGTSPYVRSVMLARKAMNSFICSTDRPFKFIGRLNDDVNAYVVLGSQGALFGSVNQVCLSQLPTQAQGGGMGDLYRQQGTYAKSFYSVMLSPSSVSVGSLNSSHTRIHHHIKWGLTYPKIVSETHRKPRAMSRDTEGDSR
jgi:hypothetical protein